MPYINSATQVGGIIGARRKNLGMTQQELATRAGISQNRLSELEAGPGRITVERLLVLFNVLGLELEVQERRAPARSTKVDW